MYRILWLVSLLGLFPSVLPGQVFRNQSDTAPRPAAIIPLHEDINFISGALLERKFQQAIDSGAEVIIFDIHSPGGLTVVTFELMDMVLDAKDIETVALIEKDAISGAALFSLACDKILIRPDARIGDAGEIVMGADGAFRYTEAKSRSVLAQKVRDTAKANGRPLALAEKLVDKDLVVFAAEHKTTGEKAYFSNREWESMDDTNDWTRGKPVREAGKEMFFTVNGERAVELGMADHVINDRGELESLLNVKTPIPVFERTTTDTLIWLLNTRAISFLLIMIGLGALMIEFSAPGIGVGGLTSILCFSLFFWSRFLGGTSGWLEVTLFAVGLLFIGLELFVIPGFGIPGLAGVLLTLGSLVMASRRLVAGAGGWDAWAGLGADVLTVVGAFIGFLVIVGVLSHTMGKIPGLSRLTLAPPTSGTLAVPDGTVPEMPLPLWQRVNVGDTGVAQSPLRPGGVIAIAGESLDATTEGDFVESGSPVRIVKIRGSQVIVRRDA